MKPSTCLMINTGLCVFNALEYYNSGIHTFAILSFVCGFGALLSLHELTREEA